MNFPLVGKTDDKFFPVFDDLKLLAGYGTDIVNRRRPIEFLGVTLDVATLEDVVLSKLEWAKLGGSARQLEDVRALLRVGADELDRAYVEQWVPLLGVDVQWRTATGASIP